MAWGAISAAGKTYLEIMKEPMHSENNVRRLENYFLPFTFLYTLIAPYLYKIMQQFILQVLLMNGWNLLICRL